MTSRLLYNNFLYMPPFNETGRAKMRDTGIVKYNYSVFIEDSSHLNRNRERTRKSATENRTLMD